MRRAALLMRGRSGQAVAALFLVLLLGSAVLVSCGRRSSEQDAAEFRWERRGDILVSDGFGVALRALPQSFTWHGGRDWGDVVVLTAQDSVRGLSLFLHAHPLMEEENLTAFADTLIRAFSENAPLRDLQKIKLKSQSTAALQLTFSQVLAEDGLEHRRLVGLFHRGSQVFVLTLDTPAEKFPDNREEMEVLLRSFRFLGNPRTDAPTLRRARERYQWYELDGRLHNDGYACSLPFDYARWVVPELKLVTDGGVVLRMRASKTGDTALLEVYAHVGETLAKTVEKHLAGFEAGGGFTRQAGETLSVEERPAVWAAFAQGSPGTGGRLFQYLFTHHGDQLFVFSLSTALGRVEQDLAAGREFLTGLRFSHETPPEAVLDGRRAFFRGYVHHHNDKPGWALEAYGEALSVLPGLPHAHWGVGILAYEAKDYAKAVRELEAALVEPDQLPAGLRLSAWEKLGQAALGRRDYGKAVVALQELVARLPEEPLGFLLLARASAGLEDGSGCSGALERMAGLAAAEDARAGTDRVGSYLGLIARDPLFEPFRERSWYLELMQRHGMAAR
jgi:hypothetical protein